MTSLFQTLARVKKDTKKDKKVTDLPCQAADNCNCIRKSKILLSLLVFFCSSNPVVVFVTRGLSKCLNTLICLALICASL